MNTYISDNLSYLKGSAGTVTIDSPINPTGLNVASGLLNVGAGGGNQGPHTTDWYRLDVGDTGLYNGAVNRGIVIRTDGPHEYLTNGLMWHSSNDGSGSGLDADLVDGLHHEQQNWTVPAVGTLPAGFDTYFLQSAGTYTLRNDQRVGTRITLKAWFTTATVVPSPGFNLEGNPLQMMPGQSAVLQLYADGATWIVLSSTFYGVDPAYGINVRRAMASQVDATFWRFDAGGSFLSVNDASFGSVTINFHSPYTSPPVVVATMNGVSGGDSFHGLQLTIRGVVSSGFIATVDNRSGGNQSMTINWMAFGP